ncbi:flavodoxin [Georgenia sp. M64]|uniref:flavodoxin n=1 Tax=Georgenia sp. M64 TaxID=3120520 RepID=UPI0030E06378
MERRTFLTGGLLLGSGLLAGIVSACTPRTERPLPDPGDTERARETSPTPSGPGRTLLAYFSRPGENYYYGDRIDLDVGNTQVVAEMIAAAADVDVYRIEAADPYPHSYEETVARNVREEQDDARPAIANPLPDLAAYDTVLLGSPVWNVQTPMIMRTFVDGADLAGRTIHPFVTYAVSGMGGVARDYAELCPAATIGDGLAVRGEEATAARTEVEAWLRRIGL